MHWLIAMIAKFTTLILYLIYLMLLSMRTCEIVQGLPLLLDITTFVQQRGCLAMFCHIYRCVQIVLALPVCFSIAVTSHLSIFRIPLVIFPDHTFEHVIKSRLVTAGLFHKMHAQKMYIEFIECLFCIIALDYF